MKKFLLAVGVAALVSAGCRSSMDDGSYKGDMDRPSTTGQEPTKSTLDGTGNEAGPGMGVKSGSGIDDRNAVPSSATPPPP